MSILVIGEKPSVSKELAKVLGADKKGNGFIEGNDIAIFSAAWFNNLIFSFEPFPDINCDAANMFKFAFRPYNTAFPKLEFWVIVIDNASSIIT